MQLGTQIEVNFPRLSLRLQQQPLVSHLLLSSSSTPWQSLRLLLDITIMSSFISSTQSLFRHKFGHPEPSQESHTSAHKAHDYEDDDSDAEDESIASSLRAEAKVDPSGKTLAERELPENYTPLAAKAARLFPKLPLSQGQLLAALTWRPEPAKREGFACSSGTSESGRDPNSDVSCRPLPSVVSVTSRDVEDTFSDRDTAYNLGAAEVDGLASPLPIQKLQVGRAALAKLSSFWQN
jgi:hypothetical protein